MPPARPYQRRTLATAQPRTHGEAALRTKSARCFTFPIPQSPAERQGQADAIRREGRVYCFAVQWVTPEALAAMEREQRAVSTERCDRS